MVPYIVVAFTLSYVVTVIAVLLLTDYHYRRYGVKLGVADILFAIIPVINLGALMATVADITKREDDYN